MASLDEILNFAVPAILILIVLGFVYTKFLEPMIIPWLKRMWEKTNTPTQEGGSSFRKKEIVYSDD